MSDQIRWKPVVAGVLLRGDEVLICQRREDQPHALEWEFPGGKLEAGETLEEALRRELNEELGISATVGAELASVRHSYAPGAGVELHFFAVREWQGEIVNRIFRQMLWVPLGELDASIFLEADRGVVESLRDRELA